MSAPSTAGQSLNGFHRTVTQDRVTAYAYASGDHNPIHLDEDFAAEHAIRPTHRTWDVESRLRVGDDVSKLPLDVA